MDSLLPETFKAHAFLISSPTSKKKNHTTTKRKKEKKDIIYLIQRTFRYCVTGKIRQDDHSGVGFIIGEYI